MKRKVKFCEMPEDTIISSPLITSQRVLTWLCVCPADENTTKLERFSYILFTFTTFFVQIILLIGSIAYFLTFMRTDMKESLYSLSQIAGSSGIMYMMIAMFFRREKISSIFTKLSKLYEASENLAGLH